MPRKKAEPVDPKLTRYPLLYFDCFAGISGSMVLGALLHLGLPVSKLRTELKKLNLKNYRLNARHFQASHIDSILADVQLNNGAAGERSFLDCKSLISESLLDSDVKKMSLGIFERLAAAEARVHNIPVQQVHFHEIGTDDAIIDIVGAAVGFNYFGTTYFCSSPLPLSSGWISSRHGQLPLPAPATLVLLEGVPTYPMDSNAEIVTPTGAAIITSLVERFGPMPAMRIGKVGYGAGKHVLSQMPNLLRLVSGDYSAIPETRPVTIIESNIDDMNPEFCDFLMEQLFAAGALDVSFSALQMKKNRPGILLRVISPEGLEGILMESILRETTSLGVRYYEAKRFTLERRIGQIRTQWGLVKVKVSKDLDGEWIIHPEYDECRKIAKRYNVPLKRIYREIFVAGKKELVD